MSVAIVSLLFPLHFSSSICSHAHVQPFFLSGKLNQVKFRGVGNEQNLHAMAFPSTLRESSEIPNSNFQIPEHIPGMSYEVSTILPGMDFSSFENLLQSKSHMLEQNQQQPCQTYWQFNKPMEIKTSGYFTEQNDLCSSLAGQTLPMHSQLPSEQLHGIQVASESSVPFFCSKGTASLENPNNAGLVRNFNDTYSSGCGSFCSENMLPSPKRLKMENPFCPISSGNGIASALAPLMIQPCYREGLPPLQQWPESPVSINSEVVQVSSELLDPMKIPTSIDQIRNSVADDYPKFNSESMSTPSKELLGGCKSEELCSKSDSEIANIARYNSNQLGRSSMHVHSEEHGAGFKEDVIEVISISKEDKPEIENELNAPEVEHKKEIKPKDPGIGVSLIEFFTAEQIKEHILSLRQWTGQVITSSNCFDFFFFFNTSKSSYIL